MARQILTSALMGVVCLLGAARVGSAQSQMTGHVRDESGAVLPGVTVEAASPVLIEKARSAITDAQGRYSILDLRPGAYRVTFSLVGFTTVVRDAIELPANFVSTINIEMKVGTLEETITVSGQTPLVDVTQAARTQVITRDVLDTLPTSRNVQSIGILVPGVRMGNPDIGGSQQMEQTRPRVHGIAAAHTTNYVDGMNVNSQEVSQAQAYINDALNAEITVVTAAQPAEIQSGGMRTNSIPKDGGNVVSGAVFLGGSDGNWQSGNVDDYLRSQNITRSNGVVHIQNFTGSLGGPVKRDRLWFFISAAHLSTDELVANTPAFVTAPDGEIIRSVLDQYVRHALGRLTYQIDERNKLASFFQRTWKRKGKDFGFGTDPRAATHRDPYRSHMGIGNIKYTGTWSSRLLLEAGYSTNYAHQIMNNQPGDSHERLLPSGEWNPVWFANARKTDTALNINRDCAYSFGCTGLDLERIGPTCGGHAQSGRGFSVVHDREPQFQGRLPEFVRASPRVQRSPGRSRSQLPERSPQFGDRVHDARQHVRQREARPGLLRPGFLDPRAIDAEHGAAGRQLQFGHRSDVCSGGSIRAGALLP